MSKEKIPFNIYNSVREAYISPQEIAELEFEEIVLLLDENQKLLKQKEDGTLFNCCSWVDNFTNPNEERFVPHKVYKRTELIRRCKDNVKHLYVLLLDIDGLMTIKEAVDKFADYEFYMYSTHSHSKEKDKFRVILPLNERVTVNDFQTRVKELMLFIQVSPDKVPDAASFTISQAFYFPSYSAKNEQIAFTYYNKSDVRFDLLVFDEEDISYNINNNVPNTLTTNPMAKSIYKTLITGSGLRYPDALTLAVICKRYGLSLSDYKNIIQTTAAGDSSLRKADCQIDTLYKSGYASYVKSKTVKELMIKLGCDMWRFLI